MNSLSKQPIQWRQSLAIRLAVVWALALGAAVGLTSWIGHRMAREQLLGSLRGTVQQDARVIRLRLETWFQTFQEDARSTSQSPLLAAFLDGLETPEEMQWREFVEGEFRAGFAGKSAYFQMRLLQVGGADDGQEILRLDRKDGRLLVTPQDRLQKKASRSYYQEALAAPPGSIYLSGINLNRDFGGITEPHIPTIRAAVRIISRTGRQAMLIINGDLRALFADIGSLSSPKTEVVLADQNGDILLHPDPAVVFATDLGHDHRLPMEPVEMPTGTAAESGALKAREKLPVGGWPERHLTLQVSLPETAWRFELEQSSRRAIWATAIASLAGAGVAILIALPFTRRLRRLSGALHAFDASGSTHTLPDAESARDEIGVALERFREMASKVGQHIDALRKAKDDAHEANAAKETFLAVMSHEIRTPMNAVVGLIRALEKNDPPPHQQPILTSLRSSASNLMTLLNTALDYTRLREGAIEYVAEPFDAAEVVREVADALTPSALAKQLDLQSVIPKTLVVRGDSIRFRQVVNNLLNNAIKFTLEGYVRASLHYADGQIEFVAADSGPGIAPEDQTNVFTPFVTLSNSENKTAPGAGLGLSVSKQMVEQQGGQLLLESQPGMGSTFTLRLPYLQGESVEASKSTKSVSIHSLPRGLRILYVEDVLSNQEVMALTLEQAAVDLTFVDTAAEALAVCASEEFDLIMVDLQLPDMAGDKLARRILEKHHAVPIIAVTAQSSARTDERIRSAGIKAVILKPFTEERMSDVIGQHVPGILADALKSIHPHDPARVSELARTMSQEFRAASTELSLAAHADDWEVSIRKIRSIRHKLTTAMAQFSLSDLQLTLDQLVESRERDSGLLTQALSQLEAAATSLEGNC